MSPTAFHDFVSQHLRRIEPLMKATRLAYWNATLTGNPEDFARFAELETASQKVYADRASFEAVKSWREDRAIEDPLDRRQLDILYQSYLRHQIPPALIERMTRASSEIVNKFNVYRAEVDGRSLTGNEVREVLRRSPDTAYRMRVWEAEKGVGKVIRDELLGLVEMRNEAARLLGFEDYYVMSLELSEQRPQDVGALFDQLDLRTRQPFAEVKTEIDSSLSRRFQIAPSQLRPWHYEDPYFQEAPQTDDLDLDRYYAGHDVVRVVSQFFQNIGLDVDDVIARSDLYEKPGKEQHAYCMDIDRNGDIRILANVRHDESWAGTMLHELGHAVYDRHIDRDLPFLLREHAHVFVTEAIAMLFGRLSKDAGWIQNTIGISARERVAIEDALLKSQRVSQLVFARWCQVMVRFERALYRDPGQDLNRLWWELVERFQMVVAPEGRNQPDWASKIHVVSAPVYYHNYLLGELLASQLHHYIQTRVLRTGQKPEPLNDRPEVGEFLRSRIFRLGKRFCWDELVHDATGGPLDPGHFVRQFV